MPALDETFRLDEVRAAAARVAARAASVRVREERLASYAAELARVATFRLFLDPRYHYLGHGDGTVAFILCLDAVNFGSGWFPWLVARPGLGGYFTLAASLKERFEDRGPPSAAELAGIDGRTCAEIFGQAAAPAPIAELMERFARAWRQLGRHLLGHFDGGFTALVAAAGGSAERLVGTLARMPGFDDVATYEGFRVPFYKRAQLTAVDLALAFSNDGPGRFDDLDRLTIFADNQVPQVLRADGALEVEADLAQRIARGDELPAGSAEEVEIRACAVHAVELLTAELAALGRKQAAWELDQLLWHRGLVLGDDAPPAHRTRTIFY